MTAVNASTALYQSADHCPGAAIGAVKTILRLEGLAALGGAVMAYARLDGQWLMFGLLFLVPDLSMLGYLANRSIGATAYNVGHSYLLPALLALLGFCIGDHRLYGVALIWVAHVGFDRLLSYGLKYPTAFGATHLGRKGKRS